MGLCSIEHHWITCDTDGCEEMCESADQGASESYAGQLAREDGWKYEDGKWKCPDCQERTKGVATS